MSKWVYSTDDLLFDSDLFETKEDAIKDAKHQTDEDFIFIGQTANVFPHIHAEDVIDSAGEQMYEENGECAEGYLVNVPNDKIDELEKELNKVFKKWIEKNGYTPTFYQVENIEQIKLEREGK